MKKIIIGNGILEKLSSYFDFGRYSKVAILTDENIYRLFLKKTKQTLGKDIATIVIRPGEREKNIKTAETIWESMIKNRLDRGSLLINLGGGVVCDLGGFVAASYMRGIDYINIPTTLLAQVDAAIGGKTGIDFMGLKNVIGFFKEPETTIIDIDTLSTLPRRELIAAFGEIIKYGIIDGREYFALVTSKKPEKFNDKELIKIIKKAVGIKKTIIEKDFKEKGRRKILNYGHTVGHAIEILSLKTKKPLLHGEAIAIGMVIEAELAVNSGILSIEDYQSIKKSVENVGLPTKIPVDFNRIPEVVFETVKIIGSDKKNLYGKILFSLPKKIGLVDFNIEIPKQSIIEVIKKNLT
jgi:3-dehydroquinate synthase